MRGETAPAHGTPQSEHISIHSPHAGRDRSYVCKTTRLSDFNPLSPCGERPVSAVVAPHIHLFQSTLPMRGETRCFKFHFLDGIISIHSPHAGRDSACVPRHAGRSNFNPLSPCGERLMLLLVRRGLSFLFQSTLPMRGETHGTGGFQDFGKNISIHSPHAGRDRLHISRVVVVC